MTAQAKPTETPFAPSWPNPDPRLLRAELPPAPELPLLCASTPSSQPRFAISPLACAASLATGWSGLAFAVRMVRL